MGVPGIWDIRTASSRDEPKSGVVGRPFAPRVGSEFLRVLPQAFLDSISAPLDRQDIIEWTEDADEASLSVLTLPESRLFLDEPLE